MTRVNQLLILETKSLARKQHTACIHIRSTIYKDLFKIQTAEHVLFFYFYSEYRLVNNSHWMNHSLLQKV